MRHSTNGGRKSKGARIFRAARFPAEYDAVLTAVAEEEGLDLGEVILNAFAEKYGLPPVAQPRSALEFQEELRLKAS
ncbi:hypothetical protein [Demequina sp.]|uniref:hypothetical protein n=1 Tax=Demequina sp. TaxID=2050685 RepID=UPI003D0E020B